MHLSQVQLNPVYKKMSDINDLRNKMDAVTVEMINLLKTRTNIAKEIGEVKKNIGKSISDEEREDNLRGKILQLSKEIGLDGTLASKFLNFLLNESIRVQSENKQTHLSIFLKAKELEQKGEKIHPVFIFLVLLSSILLVNNFIESFIIRG